MSITKGDFREDLLQNLRNACRDNITDPISSNRNEDDYFVYSGKVRAELGDKSHKPPSIIFNVEEIRGEYLGSSKVGTAVKKTAFIRIRCVGRSHADINKLASGVTNYFEDNPNDSGTWTDPDGNNHDYDLSLLDANQEDERDVPDEGIEHDFLETVVEFKFEATLT